jgi:glutathione synthase
MKLAFIIDPIAKLDPTHDSSVAMMEAAHQLGHQVYITTAEQLSVIDGQATAHLQPVQIHPVKLEGDRWIAPSPWYELGQSEFMNLNDMNAVFM